MRRLVAYLEDCALARLQRRCEHPGSMVAADLLEGCADGIRVKYCRRCGAVKTDWQPMPAGRPSLFSSIPHYWRRPDPHLWRDPAAWLMRLRHRLGIA